MGTITVLRPSATSSGVGWTATPSGTLHGVTSDDNDVTYALWGGTGSAMILTTPVDSPPAGERRHQIRLRARGEDGDAWWAVRLASGGLIAGAAASFPSSPATVTGSWGFGAPADGSAVLSAYVTGQSSGVKIQELYLDVDTRLAPTFTLSVLDGTGTPSTTISDTAQPVLSAGTPDLDDLAARQYHYWVTFNGATVWDGGVTSGPAANRQTTALDNGTYVAHAVVWSTLGAGTEYASEEETVTFTISVGAVPAPDNPVVSPVADTPFFDLEVCAPYTGDFDGGEAWLEIQRVDCPEGGYLSLPGITGAYASALSPEPGPTGDFQVTVRAQRSDDWRPVDDEMLVAKWYTTTEDHASFRFGLDSSGDGDEARVGRPFFSWSPDGTTAAISIGASERPPIDALGFVNLRVLLDFDLSGDWTLTFSTQDETGTWVRLGDQFTGAGPQPMFWTGEDIEVGSFQRGQEQLFNGNVYDVEIREGAAGPILFSPDFTGHMAGTTVFDDAQGNSWHVNAPATITSDQRITSVAILGPLATGECASYVDYSLPRTGVGLTCSHQPDPCCSYYRARTIGPVDGSLQISDWSNAFDPGVPNGMIFMWPSTNASIPAGWDRVTALDSKYPKGVATGATEPGAIGGAASHTHTVPTHVHDVSHSHTMSAATSAAVGTVQSTPNSAGALAILSTHTHTVPANVNSTTVNSDTAQPTIGTASNDPARLDVIYIESNGQPLGVPDGALGLAPDTSLSGWTDHANANGRFLKGAAAAGDGGGTAASALDSHTHSIAAHTHAGVVHTHTSSATGSASSANTLNAGPNSVTWAATHTHTVAANSGGSLGSLQSGGSGTSGATSAGTNEPPYTNVRAKENTSGADSLPVGIIGLWRGSLGGIPDNWALCDGTGGTPDLIGRYPKGATASIGTQGGSLAGHTHTSPNHSHTANAHSHTVTIGASAAATSNVSATATVTVSTGTHSHTHADVASTTATVANATSGTLASTTAEPPYEEVAFLQLVTEPAPPPDPDEFCLEWDLDEHLIRSEGPDGPLFAAVGGIFTWDVDRPFTSATGVMGGRFVTSAPPGGRNLHLVTAVESEDELTNLRAVLARPLVLVSPSDADEVWAAPVASSVRVVKIGRIRQVTADFIATGPQPAPQLADVS